MSNQTPEPFQKATVRASIIGVGVAVFGIVAFVVLWLLLAGLDDGPRLFTAMCVPPLLIALLVGGYALVLRRSDPAD